MRRFEIDRTLAERVLQGEVRAGARMMRLVDDEDPAALALMSGIYRHTGRAHIIGVTGNPGSGKSTLVDGLIGRFRAAGRRVGVAAIDPTSPFSGGAILGDRVRMQRHFCDPGVFIRSLATRGHMGGLSRSTADVVCIMDAMGYEAVIVETVGVGQDEVEVIRLCDTSIVVVVPGLGDDIQAIKAGILEIADIFVLNKCDREGADRTWVDLRTMIEMGNDPGQPRRRLPPVVRTVAATGTGLEELSETVDAHRSQAAASGELERRRFVRAREEFTQRLSARLLSRFAASCRLEDKLDGIAGRLVRRESDPLSEIERLLGGERA